MAFRPSDLRTIPLFADIPDEDLERLVGAFERRALEEGEVLFEEGSIADRLILLIDGAIEVRHGTERLTVHPVAPVGEVGALAGLHRATTAVAARASWVLVVPTEQLVELFERNGDIGFRFHHNLLHILADKVVRDRRRIEEMRVNVVGTQKAMKRMRDALLDADDTPLHRMMFEELDALVEQNRRGHYLVDVPRALPTRLRLDDGSVREVTRMSNERLDIAPGPGALPGAGGDLTAVLVAPDFELPIAGVVESIDGDKSVVALGPLIDEYADTLERHLARLQLLDVVL